MLNDLKPKQKQAILRGVVHVGALLPLVLLYIDYYTYNLGANEIRAATLRTGKPAIILLMLSLAVTPLMTIFGWRQIVVLRKPLGLYAFLYAAIHFLIFVGIDYGFEWGALPAAILDKRYALVGLIAFLLLIPLAMTSNKWSMKRLGKRWKQLHRLVYLIGVLAVIHYIWLVKNAYTEPLILSFLLLIMLVVRVPAVKTAIVAQRRAWEKRGRVVEG
ncbi:MAG TPA: protein-methionine-sulfoxide reductase heme-binding subunit MsrQ [Anaerolineae bacterium]|nr:protein-methionine-sulfoxide reductase heme-binding subunit MsrQ [Anaerolineae bacterium]